MEGGLLLDVVVLEGSAVFELFAGKDESLLIRWDAFFAMDLCLDILNVVCYLNFEDDGLALNGLYEDMHTSTESEDQMKSGLLLNVVVRKGTTVFELLASENEALLVGWDSFLVLDLGLDVLDGV